ncbi:DUF397 domain-containing protein [Actinopolymorpha pittospori]
MSMQVSEWKKSRHSGNGGNCVEVGQVPGLVSVRDTKDREGGTLTVPTAAWSAFLTGVKAGEFDLP